MTNEDANKRLKACIKYGFLCRGCEFEHDCSIEKVHEIAIDALEKQIPKKPVKKKFREGYLVVREVEYYTCPVCGGQVEVEDNEGYLTECYPSCECGQRIDWTGIIEKYGMKWLGEDQC